VPPDLSMRAGHFLSGSSPNYPLTSLMIQSDRAMSLR
jgi:hypothetical protein